jgi:DNA-binding MarR family transcriptional regulator
MINIHMILVNMQELHATALEIRILLSMATKLVGRDLEQRMLTQGLPVTSLQHGIMRLLSHQSHTISELSRKMALAPATLVPAVDALERHGLVTRGHDPSDRRRTPLLLTAQASDILARVPAVDDDDLIVKSLQSLSAAELAQLLDLLRRLVGRLGADDSAVRELGAMIRQYE